MTESQARTEVNLDGAPTIATPPIDSSTAAADARIGMLLKDSYRIERRLGSGGMGSVYLAEHEAIKKKVAVKILDVEPASRPDLKERFLREARAAAAIPDDHVIAIHDFGDTPDGSVFFVMEYLQGVDLSNVLSREAPLPWPRAREIMLQICRALQAAHERGIVHRDMKPANIFRVDRPDRDFIKVLDFGIAKTLGPDSSPGVALTRTGMLFGTPEYMSPEQAQGERLDHRVDIYASGVILFEMLTGKLPFRAETFMALLNRHQFEAPPRPSEVAPPSAHIPPAAEAVVLKALQKNPALRFQSMAEMAEALVAVDAGIAPVVVPESLRSPSSGAAMSFATREHHPNNNRRLWTIAGAAGGVALASVALFLSSGTDPEPPPEPTPVAAPPPPQPEPLPPPPEPVRDEKPPPPQATVVVITIETKIAANIYDEDNALRGNTANPDGITLVRGETERTLILRAPGYEELRIKVIPNRDTRMTAPMFRRAPKPVPPPEVKPETADTSADTTADPVDSKTDPNAKPDTKTPADTKLPADTRTDPKTPAKPETKPTKPEPPPLTPDLKPGPQAPKPKKPGGP